VTLTSSAASGNPWLLNGSAIGVPSNPTYPATTTGSYSVRVTNGQSCSATSAATTVTVNPLPPTPTISTGGASTSFCQGGSVTLTSSATSGNQSLLNGSAIGGATKQTYTASSSGNSTEGGRVGKGYSATYAAKTVTDNAVQPTPTSR